MNDIETLREAARRMRERAQVATPGADPLPGGWAGFGADSDREGGAMLFGGPAESGYRTGTVFTFDEHCQSCTPPTDADVEHIASWHPAVALAVAESLEYAARTLSYLETRGHRPAANGWVTSCIAIARAYLGVTA